MDDDNVLIRVKTENLTRKQCEKIIKSESCAVANKYLKQGTINIIQYGVIVERTTKTLLKHWDVDLRNIKIMTLKQIIHLLEKKIKNGQRF